LDEHVVIFDPAVNNNDENVAITNNRKGFVSFYNRARDYRYAFDRVFDASATQQEVYEHTTKNLIQSVLNGYNATVFAYGATGKSFINQLENDQNNCFLKAQERLIQ
jgi:kinesin family protein 18/19